MKQILMFFAVMSMLTLTAAFSSAAYAHHGPVHAETAAATSAEGKKPLIIYFSHTGNTKAVADLIGERVGGDFFEIVPQKAYPAEYKATTEQARKEQSSGFRPALKRAKVSGLEQYDVVFIGYPTWWGTLPPPVVTFLESNNLSGKRVIPFTTHGGSGMSGAAEIKRLAPGAELLEGLAIRGNEAEGARNEVGAWLSRIGLLAGRASA